MLVVGLGNPGERYAGSPHNVGFRVVDALAERAGRASWNARFDAELVVGTLAARPVVLLKPMTFMNRSGESVRKAMSFFKILEESTLVVHDELDLPRGSVKLKRGGGEAGHNGLKSVSAELGSRDYVRLRVGVGRPPTGEAVSDFLLKAPALAEAREIDGAIGSAAQAVELVAIHGLSQAMNLVNRAAAETPQAPPGGAN
jgi:PTH1 family peptidyl-tRNA hydrolase